MPYTIQKNDKGEHCVHKKNADGSVGEKVACHETKDEAIAQIGAIESSEKKPKKSCDDAMLHVNQEYDQGNDSMKSIDENDEPKVTDEPVATEQITEKQITEEQITEEPIPDTPITDDPETDDPQIDPLYTVKALGEKRLGGYGILWGDEENKDLHGEWFDPETRDIKAIFDAMGKVPLIVHHAADDEVKTFVYGEVDVMEEDEKGVWWEAKIKEFEVYREYVAPLLKRRAMFSSTGTLPAAKRRTKSGRITRWPVAEMTTTWVPAEWRMLERPVDEIKAAYKAINLNCDLSDYDDEQKKDTEGAEKARLKAIVQLHLSELELLDLE